jgi:hypothetical protein
MVAGRGTHPLGGVMVRAETTAYDGVHQRRAGSSGWRHPRGDPATQEAHVVVRGGRNEGEDGREGGGG